MRNNVNRTGAQESPDSTAAVEAAQPSEGTPRSPLEFVTPTDFVELPSKGEGYPEGHPLKGKDIIEIKFMTAKEEDILTSRALLKKNLAIERFLESVIVDKNIDPQSMLIGDRNAVLISARASGYGSIYETKVICPACGGRSEQSFDLDEPTVWAGGNLDLDNVEMTPDGTYKIKAPVTNFSVELRMMTGKDELNIASAMAAHKRNKMPEMNMSSQYERMIVSVEGYTDIRVIQHFIQNAPAKDLRAVRNIYKALAPDVRITKDFECPSCGHEQELEVSFGADFFWPDQ